MVCRCLRDRFLEWVLEYLHGFCSSKLCLNLLFSVLAKKTKKQVFVSYNLPNTDSSFTLLIENRIKEEMMAFPEKFWHCHHCKITGSFCFRRTDCSFHTAIKQCTCFVLHWLNLHLLLNVTDLNTIGPGIFLPQICHPAKLGTGWLSRKVLPYNVWPASSAGKSVPSCSNLNVAEQLLVVCTNTCEGTREHCLLLQRKMMVIAEIGTIRMKPLGFYIQQL